MKILLSALFATLGLYVTTTESEDLLKAIIPQAEEATARYSLGAIATAARVYALLNDEPSIGSQFETVYNETPNRVALTVVGNTIEYRSGTLCFALRDTLLAEPQIIEPC